MPDAQTMIDMMNVLADQRNAALNEVAKLSAMLKRVSLERDALMAQVKPVEETTEEKSSIK